VIGPLNAGLGAAGLAMAGDLAQVSPWWAAGAGAAAAAGVAARAATRRVSPLGLVYRASCWAGAGAWAAWALSTSPWSANTLAGLAAGTLAAGLAAPEMAEHEQRVVQRRRAVQEAGEQAAAAASRLVVARAWEDRLARVAQVKGTVRGIWAWPRGGYTLDIKMAGGAGVRRFTGEVLDALAVDAALPPGCVLEPHPGIDQSRVLLRVPVEDAFVEVIDYPGDIAPLTVTEGLPVGVYRDWQPAELTLLDDALIAVGVRGTGKSNFLNVVLAALARCPDALIWVVDLNGSGLARSWIEGWLQRPDGRPVIDWVAPTAAEAHRMTGAAVRIAKARKAGYYRRSKAADDDKLPVDAQVPEIVLVLDEGAEVLSLRAEERKILDNIDTLISIGRAARVQVAFSALRPNSDVIGSVNLKKQANTKVMTGPNDAGEIANLYGRGFPVPDQTMPGVALVTTFTRPRPALAKIYRLRPARIEAIAAACQAWRPALDALSVRAAGPHYPDRWDRYRTWLNDQTGPDLDDTEDTMPDTPRQDRPGSALEGLSTSAAHLQDSLASLREDAAAAEAARAGGQPDPGQTGQQDSTNGQDQDEDDDEEDTAGLRRAFAEIVADLDGGPVEGPTRMLELLAEAGEEGLHWQRLVDLLVAEGITCSKPTLYRWLSGAGDAVRSTGKSGCWALHHR
jgi:hypothetical protein